MILYSNWDNCHTTANIISAEVDVPWAVAHLFSSSTLFFLILNSNTYMFSKASTTISSKMPRLSYGTPWQVFHGVLAKRPEEQLPFAYELARESGTLTDYQGSCQSALEMDRSQLQGAHGVEKRLGISTRLCSTLYDFSTIFFVYIPKWLRHSIFYTWSKG